MFENRKRLSTMKENNNSNKRFIIVPLLLLGALFIVGWASGNSRSSTSQFQEVTSTVSIVRGKTSNGVEMLRCSKKPIELILLHGARFTKEDWNQGDILSKLCQDFSVTALDLDRTAGHTQLKEVLDSMREASLLKSFPVDAIVTPSASGRTIVDWLSNGEVSELKQYVSKWIPVAPPAVGSVDEETLEKLKGLPILAIYGDQDSMGKKVSESLGAHSQAKVVEIPGKHPCYLDSPERFVQLVRGFLE